MIKEEAVKLLRNIESTGGRFSDRQMEAVDMAIEALSTDIVRCKDCVHGQQSVVRDKAIWCDIYEQYLVGEDFCSKGCLPEIMTPPTGEINDNDSTNRNVPRM